MLIRSIPSTSGCGHRGLGRLEGNLKANDQELIVPVHVVYRFVDGKIASEYAHYDNLPLANALAEIAEAEEEAGEEDEED